MSATVTITSRPRGRIRRAINRLYAQWLRYRVREAEKDIYILEREGNERLQPTIDNYRGQCQAWRAEIAVLEQF